jgi:hypothetical protein
MVSRLVSRDYRYRGEFQVGIPHQFVSNKTRMGEQELVLMRNLLNTDRILKSGLAYHTSIHSLRDDTMFFYSLLRQKMQYDVGLLVRD